MSRTPAPPDQDASAPQWQAYAAQGDSLSERRARIAQAPEAMRPRIEAHLRTLWEVRNHQRQLRRERDWRAARERQGGGRR